MPRVEDIFSKLNAVKYFQYWISKLNFIAYLLDFLDTAQNEQVNKRKTSNKEKWLENFVRRQRLKYFSHLRRSEGLGKIILERRINGKRERERPRRH